jgi:hypothetical protein
MWSPLQPALKAFGYAGIYWAMARDGGRPNTIARHSTKIARRAEKQMGFISGQITEEETRAQRRYVLANSDMAFSPLNTNAT